MTMSNKINVIIDRRIGRNGFEGKGHLGVIINEQDKYGY